MSDRAVWPALADKAFAAVEIPNVRSFVRAAAVTRSRIQAARLIHSGVRQMWTSHEKSRQERDVAVGDKLYRQYRT